MKWIITPSYSNEIEWFRWISSESRAVFESFHLCRRLQRTHRSIHASWFQYPKWSSHQINIVQWSNSAYTDKRWQWLAKSKLRLTCTLHIRWAFANQIYLQNNEMRKFYFVFNKKKIRKWAWLTYVTGTISLKCSVEWPDE